MPSEIERRNFLSIPIPNSWQDDGQPMCLDNVRLFNPITAQDSEHQTELLNHLRTTRRATWIRRSTESYACGIDDCNRLYTEDSATGRKTEGTCRVARFCLSKEWDKSRTDAKEGDLSTFDGIQEVCITRRDAMNIGNSCPKLDCTFSAGFSIDGVAGTVGSCARQEVALQISLPLSLPQQ